MHLQNKVAVVTGGNSGIGYGTAKVLKAAGAQVVITGRRKEAVERAAAELGVTAFVADQANLADTDALVAAVKAQWGRVDILFINAGITSMSTIEEATEAHFDSIMNINLKGAYFTLSKFIPLLADGASVVFLSSNTATKNFPGTAVYAASKAALNKVMKTAALELAPRKIRVNAVSPGPVKTEIMKKAGFEGEALQQLEEHMITMIPLRKMGTSEEIGKMVAYLCGEEAGFITGAEFMMDGGMVL